MIFDVAEELGLEKMDLLDIGGGFTCIHGYHNPSIKPDSSKNFEFLAPKISALVDKVFPDP